MLLDKVIFFSYATLFFLVPLIFSPLNFELFEFSKMFLVYLLTVVIMGAWLLKTMNYKRITFNRTPLDIPLLLFLISQILSTIFSIDSHTSIWGYYSRLNGGLLSLISYLLLYFAFVSNIPKEKIFALLKIALVSGAVVSLWGILEHFGVSPSCIILKGEFNASCWVQDVQARVFATLGQPNWMAGYLGMLIFPALYFLLISKTKLQTSIYYLVSSLYYLAFTFTYSRGATLGFLGGIIIFLIILLKHKTNFKKIALVIITFLLINLLFGSALTSFKLIQKFAPPPRPTITLPPPAGGSTTQLETEGTESGQIRLIVWQGAWEAFKAYPIFGSGVETFAYSYYQFRPVEHNLTSEWDFLYNKAHNEYLNILANTGLVGLGTYILIIITFIIFIIRTTRYSLLTISLLASYLSYLIYIATLFSTVATAIFFFLIPAFTFVATDSIKPFKKVFRLQSPVFRKIIQIFIIFVSCVLLLVIFKLWYSDSLFALAQKYLDSGYTSRAYTLLTSASKFNSSEPYYQSELGYAGAATSLLVSEQDATFSAELRQEAVSITEKVLKENPRNTSFWRTAVRIYFEIADIPKAIEALDQTIKLAPTDPKLLYNKAVILESINKRGEAIAALQKAIKLKPNYTDALEKLKEWEK